VFPVLIYTDKDNLTAPLHIEDLIAKPYTRLMDYLPRFKIFTLIFKELQDEAEKLDGLIEKENLLAAILSFLIAKDEIEGQKKARLLQDTINKNPDIAMRKFIGFWFKGYSQYKKWDIKIDINEGGIAMIDTVFEQVLEKGIEKGKAEGMEKGIEKGKAEGELNKSRNIARNLSKMNMSLEQIAQVTELSVEEIQKLIS
jgi:predicted transposase/invertase (TIGR01784 family)